MKIAIVGPGALGSLFAALLAKDGSHDVWVLDHDAERTAQNDGKLLLTKDKQEFCCFVSPSSQASKIGPSDIVLLTVKSHDVAEALEQVSPLCTENTILICFQNGIGHFDALAEATLPVSPVIGVTSMGATLMAKGHVRHGGEGLTVIGYPPPCPGPAVIKRLDAVASCFSQSGIKTRQVDNILDFVWSKLLVNTGINALTVIHNCENGRLLDIADARRKMIAAVEEGHAIALALGITIDTDPVARTIDVCQATRNNISSMLQDARRQKPTEIDAINGALLKAAQTIGLDAPVNRELVRQVKEVEAGYLRTEPQKPGRDHP